MTTVKIGSKGEDVKTLQRYLGIAVTGVFDEFTRKTVIAYQTANALVADGICGEKTWAKLNGKPDIVHSHLPKNITQKPARKIKYLAIHYTAGSTSNPGSALNCRNVFTAGTASADFAVDDGTIVQFNPDPRNYYCNAVGGKKLATAPKQDACNANTLSVEMCSNLANGTSREYANHNGWYFTEETLSKAAELVRYLMREYGIPKENVVRHYDITGKLCPGVLGWNEGAICQNTTGRSTGVRNNSEQWTKFLNRL